MDNGSIGRIVGFDLGIKDYTTLVVVSILFVLFVVLFFMFFMFARKREEGVGENYGRVNLLRKKKEGKYFWD